MSNNVDNKLQIKAELLRHLETAQQMAKEDKPSSGLKVMLLEANIQDIDNGREAMSPEFWNDWLGTAFKAEVI